MPSFDKNDQFHCDVRVGEGCFIWSDRPRARFFINAKVLSERLNCKNPSVADGVDGAIECCEQNRAVIEAACQRAFAEQGGDTVDLQVRHFPTA
jgi:hypothetical protein